MSMIATEPDSKSTRAPAKRTKHLFHHCQDGTRDTRVALCGHRYQCRVGRLTTLNGLPTETCVVCLDLATALRQCPVCGEARR